MAITDLPLFSMLRTRMQWHQERQRLLAENVSNSDTQGYRPRDLAPLQFDQHDSDPEVASGSIAPRPATSRRRTPRREASQFGGYQVRPTGIVVNLEDEMIKVAANQMDYQAATTLYSKKSRPAQNRNRRS